MAVHGYYIVLVMQMRTTALTPIHLHRIMAKIPHPTYKKPYKSWIALFKSAALSYCKSGVQIRADSGSDTLQPHTILEQGG